MTEDNSSKLASSAPCEDAIDKNCHIGQGKSVVCLVNGFALHAVVLLHVIGKSIQV